MDTPVIQKVYSKSILTLKVHSQEQIVFKFLQDNPSEIRLPIITKNKKVLLDFSATLLNRIKSQNEGHKLPSEMNLGVKLSKVLL